MLDDKKLKQIERNVPLMINDGEINKDSKNKDLVKFYLSNALISLNTAKILNEVSSKNSVKKQFNFINEDFESYLWIINTSYYSMFYMAGALLSKLGVKIRSEIGIHNKTFEAFVYYFYFTKKIEKHYVKEFEEAQEESKELLGMHKKAAELISHYNFEMGKRTKFTYNIGERAKSVKASTSLKRAIGFYNECLKIIDKL